MIPARRRYDILGPVTGTPPQDTKTFFVHRLLYARDFQPRREYEQVIGWWKERRSGVCSLVGIGGAGKTAICDRFLRVLPGGLDPDPAVPKDSTLPPPGAVMVFAFDEGRHPENFFAHLHAAIQGIAYDESAPRPSYYQTRAALSGFRPPGAGFLLCLDGIEKVQDDGLRGGVFGAIKDPSFKDFIERLADGYFPGTSALITTRYPIASLEEEQPPNYVMLPVDDLSENASIALLSRRGVNGDREALRRLAARCGNHALTLELVGSYLSEFRGGDPGGEVNLPSAAEIERLALDEPNPRRRRVLNQTVRLSQLVSSYRESMIQSDPAAIALLERICLFRLPVQAGFLAAIFLGAGKEPVSGTALASLSEREMRSKLALLSEMRLIEASRDAYSVHPAVRDGFRSTFDPAGVLRAHDAIRNYYQSRFSALDSERSDPQRLDLVEELVYHTVASGRINDAYSLVGDEFNAVTLTFLGEGQRVQRVYSMITSSEGPALARLPTDIRQETSFDILVGWSMALAGLGRLSASILGLERAAKVTKSDQIPLPVFQCENSVAQGCLIKAREFAQSAIAEGTDDPTDQMVLPFWRGYVSFLTGQTASAQQDIDALLNSDLMKEETAYISWLLIRADWTIRVLIAAGQTDRAAQCLERALSDANKPGFAKIPVDRKLNIAQVELALHLGDLNSARDSLQQAFEWALARDLRETLCACSLACARVALAGAKANPARAAQFAQEAIDQTNEGLRIARDCGYSLYHIDLLNVRAAALLLQGRPAEAESEARLALSGGLPAKPQSGAPELLAATAPECGYALGEIESRLRIAEALLLRARQSGQREPWVAQACEQLELRRSRQQSAGGSAETDALLDRIAGGWLTDYPAPAQAPSSEPAIRIENMQAPVDFVIMTPLEEETAAVLRKLPQARKLPPSRDDARVYFAAELPAVFSDGTQTTYKIVVVPLADMGEQDAANATTDAIRRWKPEFVLLVGIAGGLAEAGVALGDVLIANQVADYELQGLYATGPQVRWRVHPVNRQLYLASTYSGADWLNRIEKARPEPGQPVRRNGVICTGNKVIANGLAGQYREVWSQLIGVEMEAGGVASAVFSRVDPPGFFMVRGVSDLADKDKDAAQTKSWRTYACDVAASYAVALLAGGPVVSRAGRS